VNRSKKEVPHAERVRKPLTQHPGIIISSGEKGEGFDGEFSFTGVGAAALGMTILQSKEGDVYESARLRTTLVPSLKKQEGTAGS